MSRVLYFAYGANLDLRRFRRRCPGAVVLGRALLRNYQLAFTRYDRHEKGGVADIVPEAGAQVRPPSRDSQTPASRRPAITDLSSPARVRIRLGISVASRHAFPRSDEM